MEIGQGITDGMVAVTGIWAGSVLLRRRGELASFYMGWSLLLIGLASTVGAIKFFTGLYDLLDGLHNAMAQVSGTTCMLLMGLAGLAMTRPQAIAWLPKIPVLLFCIAYYGVVAAADLFDPVRTVDTLIAIAIVFWAGWQFYKTGQKARGKLGMVVAVLLLADGVIAYGLFKEPVSFILFHAVLSVWIILTWRFLPGPDHKQKMPPSPDRQRGHSKTG